MAESCGSPAHGHGDACLSSGFVEILLFSSSARADERYEAVGTRPGVRVEKEDPGNEKKHARHGKRRPRMADRGKRGLK